MGLGNGLRQAHRDQIVMRVALIACAVLLAGCAEKPQTTTAKKSDHKAWEGVVAADGTNVSAGWKPGDEKSWEAQLRQRAQGQNEYSRSAPAASKP
jgi:hypothetical protein